MKTTVDEILELLPEVGLRLWILTQSGETQWSCQLYNPAMPSHRVEGLGTSPVASAVAALKADGVDIEVEE